MKKIFCRFIMLFVFSGLVFAQEEIYKQAYDYLNNGEFEEAISILKKEVESKPDSYDAYLAIGVAYIEKGDFDSAEKSLKKALEINPDLIAARYSLAMLYEKNNQYLKAIPEWEKILKISSDEKLKELAKKHIRQLKSLDK